MSGYNENKNQNLLPATDGNGKPSIKYVATAVFKRHPVLTKIAIVVIVLSILLAIPATHDALYNATIGIPQSLVTSFCLILGVGA